MAEEPITLERVDRAIATMTTVIDLHGEVYMPVLRRLLEERDRLAEARSLLERARGIARSGGQKLAT